MPFSDGTLHPPPKDAPAASVSLPPRGAPGLSLHADAPRANFWKSRRCFRETLSVWSRLHHQEDKFQGWVMGTQMGVLRVPPVLHRPPPPPGVPSNGHRRTLPVAPAQPPEPGTCPPPRASSSKHSICRHPGRYFRTLEVHKKHHLCFPIFLPV